MQIPYPSRGLGVILDPALQTRSCLSGRTIDERADSLEQHMRPPIGRKTPITFAQDSGSPAKEARCVPQAAFGRDYEASERRSNCFRDLMDFFKNLLGNLRIKGLAQRIDDQYEALQTIARRWDVASDESLAGLDRTWTVLREAYRELPEAICADATNTARAGSAETSALLAKKGSLSTAIVTWALQQLEMAINPSDDAELLTNDLAVLRTRAHRAPNQAAKIDLYRQIHARCTALALRNRNALRLLSSLDSVGPLHQAHREQRSHLHDTLQKAEREREAYALEAIHHIFSDEASLLVDELTDLLGKMPLAHSDLARSDGYRKRLLELYRGYHAHQLNRLPAWCQTIDGLFAEAAAMGYGDPCEWIEADQKGGESWA